MNTVTDAAKRLLLSLSDENLGKTARLSHARRTQSDDPPGCLPDATYSCLIPRYLLADLLEALNDAGQAPWVAQSGRALSDANIDALADEAERGYDFTKITELKRPL